MQNKPNFRKAKTKLNFYSTKDYENQGHLRTPGIQTQSNPISKGAPMLKAMIQVQGVFSELDKSMLVAKLRKARQAKKNKTGQCEGRKPFGFYPGEAKTLKRIKQLHRKPRGGVHPKVAMDLARHTDINLTLARYSHTLVADRANALTALPKLTEHANAPEAQRATGTYNAIPVVSNSGDETTSIATSYRNETGKTMQQNELKKSGGGLLNRRTGISPYRGFDTPVLFPVSGARCCTGIPPFPVCYPLVVGGMRTRTTRSTARNFRTTLSYMVLTQLDSLSGR